jgi:hypothetical protein
MHHQLAAKVLCRTTDNLLNMWWSKALGPLSIIIKVEQEEEILDCMEKNHQMSPDLF